MSNFVKKIDADNSEPSRVKCFTPTCNKMLDSRFFFAILATPSAVVIVTLVYRRIYQ